MGETMAGERGTKAAADAGAEAAVVGGAVSRAPLLTPAASNAKTAKGADAFEAAILHLAPADDAEPGGRTVCPMAEAAGCKAACLAFQGRAKLFHKIGEARRRKTREYFANPAAFKARLRGELAAIERRAAKSGRQAVVRLDGTSDLGLAEGLHCEFPRIMFYDYTKSLARVRRWVRARTRGEARNYHLTFSYGAHVTEAEARELLAQGVNVAVPFDVKRGRPLPTTFLGAPVIDGDVSDWRFLDPVGVVVGLRAKGDSAAKSESGFIVEPAAEAA